MNGERGETGAQGPRGPRGINDRLYGPLYGYVVASVIFTAVIYALLFQVHSDNVRNCESRNRQFQEVNDRTAKFNALFRIERNEPSHEKIRSVLTPVQNVKLTDCHQEFSRPWPFGLSGL